MVGDGGRVVLLQLDLRLGIDSEGTERPVQSVQQPARIARKGTVGGHQRAIRQPLHVGALLFGVFAPADLPAGQDLVVRLPTRKQAGQHPDRMANADDEEGVRPELQDLIGMHEDPVGLLQEDLSSRPATLEDFLEGRPVDHRTWAPAVLDDERQRLGQPLAFSTPGARPGPAGRHEQLGHRRRAGIGRRQDEEL